MTAKVRTIGLEANTDGFLQGAADLAARKAQSAFDLGAGAFDLATQKAVSYVNLLNKVGTLLSPIGGSDIGSSAASRERVTAAENYDVRSSPEPALEAILTLAAPMARRPTIKKMTQSSSGPPSGPVSSGEQYANIGIHRPVKTVSTVPDAATPVERHAIRHSLEGIANVPVSVDEVLNQSEVVNTALRNTNNARSADPQDVRLAFGEMPGVNPMRFIYDPDSPMVTMAREAGDDTSLLRKGFSSREEQAAFAAALNDALQRKATQRPPMQVTLGKHPLTPQELAEILVYGTDSINLYPVVGTNQAHVQYSVPPFSESGEINPVRSDALYWLGAGEGFTGAFRPHAGRPKPVGVHAVGVATPNPDFLFVPAHEMGHVVSSTTGPNARAAADLFSNSQELRQGATEMLAVSRQAARPGHWLAPSPNPAAKYDYLTKMQVDEPFADTFAAFAMSPEVGRTGAPLTYSKLREFINSHPVWSRIIKIAPAIAAALSQVVDEPRDQ